MDGSMPAKHSVLFEPIPGTTVIAFGHRARQGKDYAAHAIHCKWPSITHRFAFADSLKVHCRLNHGMTTKDRDLLQIIGMYERDRDPLIWVKELYYQLLEIRPQVALITDMRLPNEAQFVKQLGGVTVDVKRWRRDGDRLLGDGDGLHVSETALDDYEFDCVLNNWDGMPDEFQIEATKLAWHLMGEPR